jgi:hypothetical protein
MRARARALRRRPPPPWFFWLGLAGLLVAGAAAEGQDVGQPPPRGQQQAPQAQTAVPPASAGRGRDMPGGSSTNGVIRPPEDIDPGITQQAPATGTTPVLPPPGQPGSGQPRVVPK